MTTKELDLDEFYRSDAFQKGFDNTTIQSIASGTEIDEGDFDLTLDFEFEFNGKKYTIMCSVFCVIEEE